MIRYLIFVFVLSVQARTKLKLNDENSKFREDSKLISLPGIQQKLVESDTYRLPNNSYPDNYDLFLNIRDFDKDELEFDGSLTLIVELLEDSQNLTLHSHSSLTILDLKLIVNNVQVQTTLDYDIDRDFLIIKTSQTLLKGRFVRLEILYKGRILINTRAGIYRGSYLNQNNTRRFFIATHMQPGFFRRVCPSYDEPKFKAIFRIGLTYPKEYHAISNMQAELDSEGSTAFSDTPLMSTYLIAFVISDFEMMSKKNEEGLLFRAFARPGQENFTEFGLDVAMKALDLYENAFEMKYDENFKKLDQVALPIFNVGGMENYGIVFYRENYFLYNPEVTTAYWKELAAATIVHEVCHKFLGNLLTPEWWSVLWLSEGFCRYYEYFMTAKILPTMRMEELFAVEALQSILYRDMSRETRPMTQYEETPSRIAGLFDGIAYSKSASVIRMFVEALGVETFTKGLQIYLSKVTSNSYGSAKPENLYKALQLAIDADLNSTMLPGDYKIQEIFESWEFNSGYPIVYVKRSYNDRKIRFTQQRFTDPILSDSDEEVEDSIWHIPITYASKVTNSSFNENKPRFWLQQKETEITLNELRSDSYFLVNVQQVGYYRVQYDDSNWELIAKELSEGNFSMISANSRAMLIDDASVFFEMKILKLRILLEIIKYLEHDIDYIPWMAATANLGYIRRMMDDDNEVNSLSRDFKKFLQILLAKTYDTFGSEEKDDEPHYHKHIRNIAINWACQAHLESCLNDTRKLYHDFIEGKKKQLSKDHEPEILCNGLLKANDEEYEAMLKLFKSTQFAQRRELYLRSMGCIENEEILTRFMNTILDKDTLDDDEWETVILVVYSNGPIGMRVAMRFFRYKYKEFIDLLNDLKLNVQNEMNQIFGRMALRINNEQSLRELRELTLIYGLSEIRENRIVEIAKENLEWIELYADDIREFLDDFFRERKSSSSRSTIISCLMILSCLAFNWIMQN